MSNFLRGDKLTALFGLMFCLLLAALSFPRLMAAVYLLYPAQVAKQYKQSVDSVNLDHFVMADEYIKQSLKWSETGDTWQILALNKGKQFPLMDVSLRRLALSEMRQASINGLVLSPIDPYAWYRLASIEKSLNRNATNKIIGALRLSCYAGRVEPTLVLKRVEFLHQYMNKLDEEMKNIFYDQIRVAGQIRFWSLVKLIKKTPALLPWVKDALQYDLELLEKILKQV